MNAIEKLAHHGYHPDPRVRGFRRDRVMHIRYQEAIDQVAERIQHGEQQSMTAVVGPTATGKTALIDEFGHQFQSAMRSVPEEARTTLLTMELAAPEHGTFKWANDFYIPALEALNEPCTTKKINIQQLHDRLAHGETKALYASRPKTIPQWRDVFYAALVRAKTIAAIFDEANHLRRPVSRDGVFGKYDSLKSRSDACATHFVLVGTVEVADIFKQNGQISKRVYPIWMNPYGIDQIAHFGGALLSIEAKLPVKITFCIDKKLTLLFEMTLGLFGLAHDWFDRALVRAISRGKECISWVDMEVTALHPLQLSGIVSDLIKFRQVQTGVDVYLKEQMKLLFLPPDNKQSEGGRQSTAGTAKPFVRKPERDPVAA